jgi:hypothetical protein
MHDAPQGVKDMFRSIFLDMEKARLERIEDEAKKNPKMHRDTMVIERGQPAHSNYFAMKGLPKGKQIRFCWSKHRNVAGYYLTWTEVWNRKEGKRVSPHGWETKHDAIEYARTRVLDAAKPKAERKFTLPNFKIR